MIEVHSETLHSWKSLNGTRLRIGMANRAHRVAGVRKLFRMTTSTWRMLVATGHCRLRTRILPTMTQ
jgi:hypothetical protein